MKKIAVIAVMALNSVIGMAQVDWSINPVGAVFARQGATTPKGTFRLTSGGYEVFTIACSDKAYQPASLYYGENSADKEKVDALVPDGRVPTAMNCFVVRTPDGYIMFDTGLPESRDGKTLARLAALKIKPAEISAIYVTHSHFDHIGGLLDDTGRASYTNATLYIPAEELTFMRKTMKESCQKIESAYSGRIVTFQPGEILPNDVLPIAAKGHTPGHTAYQLGNLLFVGDLMHGPSIQLIDPTINANYDANRAQAASTRTTILSYAACRSLTLLGAHIPLNGFLF